MRVVLADGMSFMAPDTPEIARRLGKASNQHRRAGCSYPVPKLLALVDWGTGMVTKVLSMPYAASERVCLHRLLGCLAGGDLLLADRGLVSFAHVAIMLQAGRGVNFCLGLPRCMAVPGGGKAGHLRHKRLGTGDLLVRWLKPRRRPRWMSKTLWGALPRELVLRQVSYRVRRPGFRDQWRRLVTSLTDPVRYPAGQLVELYAKRWRIEVCFRDLKRTLGMRRLRSRSVAGVRKEIACFLLLYNLVRQVMLEAAGRQRVDPDRVSFVDALRWLLWGGGGPLTTRLVVNPSRRRPAEPRVLKHGRHKYPLMNRPRPELRKALASQRLRGTLS